jgi:anti-sigma regulatory factor (Ser/Thr protein kinase)
MAKPPIGMVSFRNLEQVTDELHQLFEGWQHKPSLNKVLSPFAIEVLKLAVHEWVANLVQHGDFSDREPEISLQLAGGDGRVHCLIEDNSDGFDFQNQLGCQRDLLEGSVPPERGRGLLMLIACTRDLSYQSNIPGRQRLQFWVAGDGGESWDIPF